MFLAKNGQPRRRPSFSHPRLDRPELFLLDDEVSIRKAIKLMLEFWFDDYTVTECVDGDQALSEVLRQAPDLLITDFGHPGARPDEMLAELSGGAARFPVLVASAYISDRPELQDRLVSFGFDVQFLHKPFDAGAGAFKLRLCAISGLSGIALSIDTARFTGGTPYGHMRSRIWQLESDSRSSDSGRRSLP